MLIISCHFYLLAVLTVMQNIDENKNTLPYRDTSKKLERIDINNKI